MIMVGSSIGPLLGGALVQNLGYSAIGIATIVVAVIGIGLAFMAGRRAALWPSVPMAT